jgi:hypothetical protein
MPDVTEVFMARMHWEKGALGAYCQGDAPTEVLLDSLAILEAEISAVESWMMTPKKDGGGRE